MSETEPKEQGVEGTGWTVKKVRQWVKKVFQCEVSRSLLLRVMNMGKLSWKKCQKVLGRAKPEKRAAYIAEFQKLFAEVCAQEKRLIYVDEAHIHREMDRGYTWSPVGQRAWRMSDCPSLSERVNWYGAYDFTNGQCMLGQNGKCNGDNTLLFLRQLKEWIGEVDCPVVIIWDGASYHRDKRVKTLAAQLNFILTPLPGYSPDLNPIEGLWQWMREEVTKNYCHPSVQALKEACAAFIERINTDPIQLVNRLWPKFKLNPEYEKLLLSI